MSKMKEFLKQNKVFLALLFVVFLVHLVFFAGFHEILWDSGVYVGMGKFLFSGGSAGLWEHIRPPFWPAVLGLLWFLGLGSAIFGLILELLLSLGAVVLLYQITKHYFKEPAALFASAIFSFSSIFFYLGFHLYTEVPAVFFVLLSVYLFIRKRFYWSGFAVALAFLSKFPAGMFLLVLLFVLLLDKDIKSSLKLSTGFLIPVIPVLIAYQIVYSSAMFPFLEAREVILRVLGCNVLRFRPWWHYFYLIYSENVLNLFAIAGLFAFFVKFKKDKLLPLLCLAVPLVYFSQMHCRDYRYLVLFIPFVAMFSSLGIIFLLDKIKSHKKQVFTIVLIAVLGFSVFNGVRFYINKEVVVTNPAAEGYFRFLEHKDVSGEIWSSNPVVAVYTDAKVDKIYYPVYDAGISADFYNYLTKHTENVEYVFLDNCGGGIICRPDDAVCEEKNKDLRDFLDANLKKVYDEEYGRCFYLVYKN